MTRQPLVLVVDDEATIRDVVRRYLEADGLQVMEAPDGDTALAMVVEHRPDVVVLDVATGEEVALPSLAPSSTPLLLWMWAPH